MLIQSIFENQSSFSPSSVLNDHSLVKLISKQKQNSKEFLAGNSVRKFHDLEAPKRFNNYAERSKEIVCGEEKFVLSFLVTCLDLQASLLGTGILDHTLKSFSLSICLVPHQEFQSVYLSLRHLFIVRFDRSPCLIKRNNSESKSRIRTFIFISHLSLVCFN